MPRKIVNRFRILLAQKATKQQQNITLMDVQRETGIAWSTLNSWSNNQLTRYDAPLITRYANILITRNLLPEKLIVGKPGYNYFNKIQHVSAMNIHRGGSFLMIAFFLIEDL